MSYGIISRKRRAAARHTSSHEHLGGALGSTRVSSYFAWKPFVDLPLAAILLVLAAPVIAVLWLLVKCTSRGPGFYRQQRVGRFGRPYYMYKMRSMRQQAEAGTGAVWCATNDPRVTRLGNVLRKFHLDELPQLYNVLKGEMSLVGPRPERPEFVQVLVTKLDGYQDRLLVPPGITGLAQLNLRPDADLNDVARKLVLDLEYINRASLWLEARLLLCTATRVVKVPTIQLLGLYRNVELPTTAAHRAAHSTVINAMNNAMSPAVVANVEFTTVTNKKDPNGSASTSGKRSRRDSASKPR